MLRILLIQLFIFLSCTAKAQLAVPMERASDNDSSYYDIYRLSNGDIWMAGEFGILKRIRNGEISTLKYPATGHNLLKIVQVDDMVYISADKGTIFTYNLQTETFARHQFKAFKHQCFYDIIPDGKGSLIVCGGSSGIGKGKVRIPRGFIAKVPVSLNEEPQVLWKNTFEFVWALCRDTDGRIAAAVFNGVNTHIRYQNNDERWREEVKIPGLVHGLQIVDNQLSYSGTASIRYQKTGTWGFVHDPESHREIKKVGLICGLVKNGDALIAYSQAGQILQLNSHQSAVIMQCESGAVYEALSDAGSVILVGHGKSCIRLNLNEATPAPLID